ncbi:hypothetical protein FB645_003721 [Coemansia sp. IMI 203386]|nr:hypothetical protein FB645_003721 [Coemansia sp. IMI 203386]
MIVALKVDEEFFSKQASSSNQQQQQQQHVDGRKTKHPPVQPTYYNSRLAPLRSNSSLPLAYHGEYQGVPLLEEAVATPVIAKRRNQLEAEMAPGFKSRSQSRPESESESTDHLRIKAVIQAEQKPKMRTKSKTRQKRKSKRRSEPKPDQKHVSEQEQEQEQEQAQGDNQDQDQLQNQNAPDESVSELQEQQKQKHESLGGAVVRSRSGVDSGSRRRPKSAVHTEIAADEMPKRPSTSHAKARKSLSAKRRSKSSSAFKEMMRPPVDVDAVALPPIAARSVSEELPREPTPVAEEEAEEKVEAEAEAEAKAGLEPDAQVEVEAEEKTDKGTETDLLRAPANDGPRPATANPLSKRRPASVRQSPEAAVPRPATANPLAKQRPASVRQKPEPAVTRSRPQTCAAPASTDAEHVQPRPRPGTAAPSVTAISAQPRPRPEAATRLLLEASSERARPATTGHLNDTTSQRPATSKSLRKSRSRPNTSQQTPARPRTAAAPMKRDRRHSEWRDIHVQSLSRVDSILREAVGLDGMSSSGNRWSTLVADAEPLPSTGGLGISINGNNPRTAQRPETTYGRMSASLRQQSGRSFAFLDHDVETLSKSLQDAGTMADAAPRPRTTDDSRDPAAVPKRPYSGKESQRASSAYPAGHRRPATSHVGRRQMSMYNPAVRQIQLSRDESRRSRLFAEYEKLVGSKEKAPEDEDDDEDDETRNGQVGADDSASSESPDATPKVSLDNIAEEDEDDFADSRRRNDVSVPTSSASTVACEPTEDVPEGRRAMDQPSRQRPSTVHFRTSAEELPAARNARPHSASMQHHDDDNGDDDGVFSRQQSQKRWTRMISQNQHLFDVQAVVAAGALGEGAAQAEAKTDPAEAGPAETDPVETDPADLDLTADVISLASDEDTSDIDGETAAMRSAPVPLTLDLPPAVDLFQDVEQALAERLPPASAGCSTPRGTSGAGWPGHGNAQSRPLGAMPLYSPQAFSAFGVNIFGGRDHARSPRSAHYAESTISALSLARGDKRSSVYVVDQEVYASAVLGGDELPYQQERRATATAAAVGPRLGSRSGPVPVPAPAPVSVPVRASPPARSPSLTSPDPQRHSAIVRQQLRVVEGTTPAAALGQALAKGDEAHREMLLAYMQRFDFHDQPIDFALRQLFQQLHLPAESQQIDRVITGFAEHYHRCNTGVFFSADIVYAYAFAILLLHTDAHNPRVKHKMTKSQFISQAKLLDDGDEMFDEILDVLYDNVTMVRFEYAPAGAPRPQTADAPRDHSPGITGWLRRMFAPAAPSAAPVQSPVPLSPQAISKQQYSYTTLARRGAGAQQVLSPAPQRPATAGALSPTSPVLPDSPPRFTPADITVAAQPLAVETIRLSSLKSHVKRRPSLRQGRPLSGIVAQPPQLTSAATHDSMAQLRVDMAGRVMRKIERQDNGRRALVRRWKHTYLVLSGSRLYFLRPDANGTHHDHTQAQAIMSIVPLRHGVAIVDAQYNKYPHVFRILAGDGSQILIKAADDDAVAEWMARINCAAAFKSTDIARREKPFMPDPARAHLLETRLLALDAQLSAIDDKLERHLRLFKQLAAMVPLTKASRSKIVQHADHVRGKLSDVFLDEQRLTCYKDVLHLDLTIEYELSAHADARLAGWDEADEEFEEEEPGLDENEVMDEDHRQSGAKHWSHQQATPSSTWDNDDDDDVNNNHGGIYLNQNDDQLLSIYNSSSWD